MSLISHTSHHVLHTRHTPNCYYVYLVYSVIVFCFSLFGWGFLSWVSVVGPGRTGWERSRWCAYPIEVSVLYLGLGDEARNGSCDAELPFLMGPGMGTSHTGAAATCTRTLWCLTPSMITSCLDFSTFLPCFPNTSTSVQTFDVRSTA